MMCRDKKKVPIFAQSMQANIFKRFALVNSNRDI